jgi:hypothetical protein
MASCYHVLVFFEQVSYKGLTAENGTGQLLAPEAAGTRVSCSCSNQIKSPMLAMIVTAPEAGWWAIVRVICLRRVLDSRQC